MLENDNSQNLFRQQVQNPVVVGINATSLGTDWRVGSMAINETVPGSVGQEEHIDYTKWRKSKKRHFLKNINFAFFLSCSSDLFFYIIFYVSSIQIPLLYRYGPFFTEFPRGEGGLETESLQGTVVFEPFTVESGGTGNHFHFLRVRSAIVEVALAQR